MNSEKFNILICQMSSGPKITDNISVAEDFLSDSKNCDLAIFPECSLLWAKKAITHQEAQTEANWLKILSELSIKYKTTIIWGGIAEEYNDKIFNTSFIINKDGNLIAKYRKTHLFQIFADEKLSLDETDVYSYGDTGPVAIEIGNWKIGISICYDLRFPELYRNYTGCDLMINTAAFTRKTGKAHWELLLRARAVENQCYMLGVGQCGRNELTNITAYGNSMLVDPWGEIKCNLGEEVKSCMVSLEKSLIQKTRSIMPALNNRRM